MKRRSKPVASSSSNQIPDIPTSSMYDVGKDACEFYATASSRAFKRLYVLATVWGIVVIGGLLLLHRLPPHQTQPPVQTQLLHQTQSLHQTKFPNDDLREELGLPLHQTQLPHQTQPPGQTQLLHQTQPQHQTKFPNDDLRVLLGFITAIVAAIILWFINLRGYKLYIRDNTIYYREVFWMHRMRIDEIDRIYEQDYLYTGRYLVLQGHGGKWRRRIKINYPIFGRQAMEVFFTILDLKHIDTSHVSFNWCFLWFPEEKIWGN